MIPVIRILDSHRCSRRIKRAQKYIENYPTADPRKVKVIQLLMAISELPTDPTKEMGLLCHSCLKLIKVGEKCVTSSNYSQKVRDYHIECARRHNII